MLLQDWEEIRVYAFGPMMAQRRLLFLLDYQDDLALFVICGFLAEMLEPLIIDANTVDLRVQMAKNNGATMSSTPAF